MSRQEVCSSPGSRALGVTLADRVRPCSWLVVVAGVLLAAEGCAKRIHPAGPSPAGRGDVYIATAYCAGRTTAAGTRVARGVVAADPSVLPLGTVIRVTGLARPYNGVYTVSDTGSAIRGRRLDLYIGNCTEALRFGRQPARVSILRQHSRP